MKCCWKYYRWFPWKHSNKMSGIFLCLLVYTSKSTSFRYSEPATCWNINIIVCQSKLYLHFNDYFSLRIAFLWMFYFQSQLNWCVDRTHTLNTCTHIMWAKFQYIHFLLGSTYSAWLHGQLCHIWNTCVLF